ncbi:MAG: glycosyltransferase [Phormidium tanganyikae FI6-MK23]|jgi:glycosyltransferase involved in cell wall biosynthesis|nr:glycosyltransferase [Phormidium tanganyikae FI6-MK23]
MKLLIQHTHKPGEIAGVLTYIDAIVPGLNATGVETQILSTQTTTLKSWIAAIRWADIVHMNSNHLGFALLCKLLGKKIIIKYHYLFYISTHSHYEKLTLWQRLKLEFIQTLPKPNYPLKWKLHTVIKWARFGIRFGTALLCNRHTACSQFLAESLSFPWKVTALNCPIESASNQKSLEDLTLPYTFAYVGRLNPDKGVDLLLRATKLIQDYSFQVKIIGSGQDLDRLKALVEELEISSRVEFLGSLPNKEALEIVRSSLALVVPSRWQEPAGYVALEASSVRTCSIVSKVGGLPEMAGESNLFFDREDYKTLAQQMQICLENLTKALERGNQANQYISEQFTCKKAVQELLEICQELEPNLFLI